jgi:hypothetical protein
MRALRRTVVVALTILATGLVASPGLASDGTARAQRRLNALGCAAGRSTAAPACGPAPG